MTNYFLKLHLVQIAGLFLATQSDNNHVSSVWLTLLSTPVLKSPTRHTQPLASQPYETNINIFLTLQQELFLPTALHLSHVLFNFSFFSLKKVKLQQAVDFFPFTYLWLYFQKQYFNQAKLPCSGYLSLSFSSSKKPIAKNKIHQTATIFFIFARLTSLALKNSSSNTIYSIIYLHYPKTVLISSDYHRSL